MRRIIDSTLSDLKASGNLRAIPADATSSATIDLSSNDYLGIGSRTYILEAFLAQPDFRTDPFTASASRLLARNQSAYEAFEKLVSEAYGRPALALNSGYHANTGLISAFAGTGAHILADKLVHASIIDGIRLSGLPFDRFRHNDISHLERLAERAAGGGRPLLILAESVYSMDGDHADIEALAEVKRRYPGSILYIDEAHAVGCEGPAGLGLAYGSQAYADVDIIIGTMGKALASAGAYAVMTDRMRSFMVNKARSLIFSTALPPANLRWSCHTFATATGMDTERERLRQLAGLLSSGLAEAGIMTEASHIQPVVVGSPTAAVSLSAALHDAGFDVLPIRTPTVPPGTDRLRISLNADIAPQHIIRLTDCITTLLAHGK